MADHDENSDWSWEVGSSGCFNHCTEHSCSQDDDKQLLGRFSLTPVIPIASTNLEPELTEIEAEASPGFNGSLVILGWHSVYGHLATLWQGMTGCTQLFWMLGMVCVCVCVCVKLDRRLKECSGQPAMYLSCFSCWQPGMVFEVKVTNSFSSVRFRSMLMLAKISGELVCLRHPSQVTTPHNSQPIVRKTCLSSST